MMKASLKGRFDAEDNVVGVGTFVVNGGDIKLRATVTGDTFVKGNSLNGLTLSVEKPGFFNVEYDVSQKDVQFQFMNTVRVGDKPLNLTYTHSWAGKRTAVDGTLVVDPSHKFWASYGIDSGNCKVKYSYVRGGVTTFEPCYDFAENSWDLAVSQKVYNDSVVRASYQSSSKVLGLDWTSNSFSNAGLKVSATLNLADEKKMPKLTAESSWDIVI